MNNTMSKGNNKAEGSTYPKFFSHGIGGNIIYNVRVPGVGHNGDFVENHRQSISTLEEGLKLFNGHFFAIFIASSNKNLSNTTGIAKVSL